MSFTVYPMQVAEVFARLERRGPALREMRATRAIMDKKAGTEVPARYWSRIPCGIGIYGSANTFR